MSIYISSSLFDDFKKVVELATELNTNIEISRFGNITKVDQNINSLIEHHKKCLKNFSGKISFHSFFLDLNPSSPDPHIKKATIHRYNQTLEIAKALNADTVVFHSGYNGLVKHPLYEKIFAKEQINFWSEYIKEFEKCNITAALENTYENIPEKLLNTVNSVNSNHLKICIDIGHVNINSEKTVDNWIEATKDKLHHMHIHNNFEKADDHNSILDGTINHGKMVQKLKEYNLKPNMVAEIFNKDATLETVEYLRKNFNA